MSQTKPTPDEATSFCRHLIEYGEKRQLDAFRVTYPHSSASNASASVAASRLAQLPQISLRMAELHTQSKQLSSTEFLLDVEYKKRKLLDIIETCAHTIESQDGHNVMIEARSAIAAIAESNRMDGEYARDNEQRREPLQLLINLAGRT